MRASSCLFLLTALAQPLYAAAPQWQNECVGYYQLQLPARIAPVVFPAGNFIHPPLLDAVYGDYRAGIVSKRAMPANLQAYRNNVQASKTAFSPPDSFLIKEYPQAFTLYEPTRHTVYINRGKRWFHFWPTHPSGQSRSADDQWRNNDAQVQLLTTHFRSRALFDIPATPGFCLPFGFIAADSGDEYHNVAATWRLKHAPDVTIHFQTLGLPSEPGQQVKLTDKAWMTQLWARRYQRPPVAKTVIEPQWRVTRMAERYGLSTFIESTFVDGSHGFDYIAWVAGDPLAPGKTPGLLLHIMLDSRKEGNKSRMTQAALEEMAEAIAASVKRR